MSLDIEQIPVLNDNYIYLLRDRQTSHVAVIDPAEAAPVRMALDQLGWGLNTILNTHHHFDHVGGNLELKQYYACQIMGPAIDEQRIPGIDRPLSDGEEGCIGNSRFQYFDTPGHTRGHGVFWFPDVDSLFCGDTLFALGCGRLFEGSPEQMWTSLQKIRALPDATRIYCAHEYTADNARFALSIDPKNPDLQAYQAEILRKRSKDQPTVPSQLAREKKCNPFLRADDAGFQAELGMSSRSPAEVFAWIRQKKDQFN